MFERTKREIIEERGFFRAMAIIGVIVLTFIVLSLALDIGIALFCSVGAFLVSSWLMFFLVPGSLVVIAFAAGAGWLRSGAGIMVTLFLIVLRYLATFFWWSKWFWVCLIVPVAVYFGIQNFVIDVWNAPGYFASLPTDNLMDFLNSIGMTVTGFNFSSIMSVFFFIVVWFLFLFGAWQFGVAFVTGIATGEHKTERHKAGDEW